MTAIRVLIDSDYYKILTRLAREKNIPTSAYARIVLLEHLIEVEAIPKPEDDSWKECRKRRTDT